MSINDPGTIACYSDAVNEILREPRRRLLAALSIGLVGAITAAVLGLSAGTPVRTPPIRTQPLSFITRSQQAARTNFVAAFAEAFRREVQQYKDEATRIDEALLDPGGANSQALGRRLEFASVHMEARTAAWLRRIGALPHVPRTSIAAIQMLIRSEAEGHDAPYSTAVALEVIALVPELSPPGLLVALASDPPGGLGYIARLALDTLSSSVREEDVSFLREMSHSPDPRLARRAASALGHAQAGPAELADLVSSFSGEEVPDAIATELRAALRGGGSQPLPEAALLRLLESGDSRVAEEVLLAIGDRSDVPTPALAEKIFGLAVSPDYPTEACLAAVPLLQRIPEGPNALKAVAESAPLTVVRIRAIQSLCKTSDSAIIDLSLQLLHSIAEPTEVAYLARVAAACSDDIGPIARAVAAWVEANQAAREEVFQGLCLARSSHTRALALALFGEEYVCHYPGGMDPEGEEAVP